MASNITDWLLIQFKKSVQNSLSPFHCGEYFFVYMSRILLSSRNLIRGSTVAGTSVPAAGFVSAVRHHSGRPEKVQLMEFEIETDGDVEVFGMRLIEEAIHAIIARRCAPDWLPFVPGASYWVPPRKRPSGIVEIVGRLTSPLTEEEAMSFTTIRGWPSSAYFIQGTSEGEFESSEDTRTQLDED